MSGGHRTTPNYETRIVTEAPLRETLDCAIEAQERICERDSSVDAWTVLCHLRVLRDDLDLTERGLV